MTAFSFTASAAGPTTNKYTYIRMAPYWTAEVVDNLVSGASITILEREYEYLYVEYNNGTKRGYIPKADTNATGYSWCQHGEYNSGYNKTASAQTVYYKAGGGASCGTIDAHEGEVANKPLLVLRVESGSNYNKWEITPAYIAGSTLMYPLRDRTTLIAPTIIDIAAVKKNYCSK